MIAWPPLPCWPLLSAVVVLFWLVEGGTGPRGSLATGWWWACVAWDFGLSASRRGAGIVLGALVDCVRCVCCVVGGLVIAEVRNIAHIIGGQLRELGWGTGFGSSPRCAMSLPSLLDPPWPVWSSPTSKFGRHCARLSEHAAGRWANASRWWNCFDLLSCTTSLKWRCVFSIIPCVLAPCVSVFPTSHEVP